MDIDDFGPVFTTRTRRPYYAKEERHQEEERTPSNCASSGSSQALALAKGVSCH